MFSYSSSLQTFSELKKITPLWLINVSGMVGIHLHQDGNEKSKEKGQGILNKII